MGTPLLYKKHVVKEVENQLTTLLSLPEIGEIHQPEICPPFGMVCHTNHHL